MIKAVKVTVDNEVSVVELESTKASCLANNIGCDFIELVRPFRLYTLVGQKRLSESG